MDFDIRPVLWLCGIIGAVVIGMIWAIVHFTTDPSIKTKHPIKPDTEIVIINGKADTTFIYHRP